MNRSIKIEDLFTSTIMTPHNLLEMFKKGDYEGLNFNIINDELHGTINFKKFNELVVMVYIFDLNNYLKRIIICGDDENIIFDRESEKMKYKQNLIMKDAI